MAVKKSICLFLVLSLLSCSSEENKNGRQDQPEPPDKGHVEPVLRAGAIIFQVSGSGQGKAIQIATGSTYSHCGILVQPDQTGQLYVLEAVQPVKITPFDRFVARGDNNGHYVIKQLKNDSLLTPEKQRQLLEAGKKYVGKDYDLYFGWGNDRIYCSELVWKLYKDILGIEVGKLQKLKEFELSHPIVQKKLKERYGNNIPYDEQVISPAAIFDSPLLETVMEQ
jgi:hypothetical protein